MTDRSRDADRRRADRGAGWLGELATKGRAASPHLVRDGNGRVHLVEGSSARPVASGILANALESSLGSPREITELEQAGYQPGVPVEVFETSDGQAFLVIGGERRRLKGLPLPHRVDDRALAALTSGTTIDVAAANVSRRRLSLALSWRFQLDRLRAAVRRRGFVGSLSALGLRAQRSFKRRASR